MQIIIRRIFPQGGFVNSDGTSGEKLLYIYANDKRKPIFLVWQRGEGARDKMEEWLAVGVSYVFL